MESNILVVEESVDLCRLFEYILRADGHTVAAFTDWRSAQTALGASTPDLIIFDWNVSNGTGYEWIASLSHTSTTSNIPILLVCGDRPTQHTLAQLSELGVSMIDKPFDIFIFRNRLNTLLGMNERAFGA